MAKVIGVKFKDGGKVYYFDPCGIDAAAEQSVIVETARGVECGVVAMPPQEVPDGEIVKPLKRLLRIATKKDIAQAQENRLKEERAFTVCQQKIIDHKMEMKLVDVEYAFDGSKILFYFTADGRVDFRELVKDLAGVFRTRIELRQIGVRDEAKMLGGLGICGREFCCSSFLGDFQPVSIRMAKEQGLSLNPTKISGTCGRLMCCLKYEQAAYEDLIKTTPRQNSVVNTPDGRGVVTEVSLLTGMLKVRLDGEMSEIRVYHKSQLDGSTRCPGCRREESSSSPAEESAPLAPAAGRPQQDSGRPASPRRQQQERRPAKPAAKKFPAEAQPKPAPSARQEKGAAPEGEHKPRRCHRRGGVRHRPKPAGQTPANSAAQD